MESGATSEFHVVPPFLNAPVCLEPWLQVADAAEPLKRKVKPAVRLEYPRALLILPLTLDSGGLLQKKQPQVAAQGPGPSLQPCHQPQELEGPLGARGHGARSWWRVKACHRSSPGTARTHIPDASPLGLNRNL